MHPAEFPESNTVFGPPADLDESQCSRLHAYVGQVRGGCVDGKEIVVVAWQPSPQEILQIAAGQPIFLSFIGGLPPHFPAMSFHEATHPA